MKTYLELTIAILSKLTLNAPKTEFMFILIGSSQRLSAFGSSPSFIIDGAPVCQATFTKSLGVYIDQNLSWSVHVLKFCKKIATGIWPATVRLRMRDLGLL